MTRTLFTAQHVLAGDPPREGPTAFVVEDDRFTWVGDPEEQPRGRVRKRNRVDLDDAWIVPGFVDPHFHLSAYAVLPGWADLSTARTVADIQGALREAAARAPEGTWIVGWGCRELVTGLDRRLTRAEVDAAVPDRPAIVIHASYHSSIANSAALASVGFGRNTPRSYGGELERDASGEPNGRAWERAHFVLEWAARRAELDALGEQWGERVRALSTQLLAGGITHVSDAAMGSRERELAQSAGLPLGLTAMPVSENGMMSRFDEVLAGPRTGEGDMRFRIGPAKLIADGAERCAMFLPYPVVLRALRGLASSRGGPSPLESLRVLRPRFDRHGVHTGTTLYRPDELADAMARAAKAGFSVAVHAIGNEAIDQVVTAYERTRVYGGRIEHAMFASERQAERMARLGVTAVIQPGHLFAYGASIADAGLDAYLPPVPARRLLDAGVKVSLSSDGPTALWDPLTILRLAVDRRTEDGRPLRPDQALTREEALRAATVQAAEAAGVGEDKGQIAAGRLADFVVLSGDPFDEKTRVRETWVGGRKAWEQVWLTSV